MSEVLRWFVSDWFAISPLGVFGAACFGWWARAMRGSSLQGDPAPLVRQRPPCRYCGEDGGDCPYVCC